MEKKKSSDPLNRFVFLFPGLLWAVYSYICIDGICRVKTMNTFDSDSPRVSSPQASGVKVTDEVIAVFNDMKVRKAQANEDEKRKRKKAILFCLSKDLKNIVLDEGKEILLGDLGTTVTDPYQKFVSMLPPNDCRYALYDATYETKETKKEDLVFIFW